MGDYSMKYYNLVGQIYETLPRKLTVDGKIIFNPKWNHFEQMGWKVLPESYDKDTWKFSGGFYVEKTQEELDSNLILTFETNKQQKLEEIDAKTNQLISQGFVFDGHTFSLSLNAQSNFMGIKVATDGGLLTEANYPYELTTIDDGAYELSWALKDAFFGSVLTAVATHLAYGRALKVAVKSATTQADLDLVVDNR